MRVRFEDIETPFVWSSEAAWSAAAVSAVWRAWARPGRPTASATSSSPARVRARPDWTSNRACQQVAPSCPANSSLRLGPGPLQLARHGPPTN
jgi:hypothetical protein